MKITVNMYFYNRKPLSKLWFLFICNVYYIAVRLFGFKQFNYMEGNFLGKLHRKYFADLDYTDGSVGISGFMLAMVRILLVVLLHETLFTYGLKLKDGYTLSTWLYSVGLSYLLSPLVIILLVYYICKLIKREPKDTFFGNTLKRFIKGAYIPIPYTIIWLFGK